MKRKPTTRFALWKAAAPGALGERKEDRPILAYYEPPATVRGKSAMLVLPGGGYGYLADHEGSDYAIWLADRGIHAFVLHYRLGSHGYRHPTMITDAARAIRLIRSEAARWRISRRKVGVMGSSAGGHLAATLATLHQDEALTVGDTVDQEDAVPNFAVLCYPVITMGPMTHKGSRDHLLGKRPSETKKLKLSAESRVNSRTPPCFVWHTLEDDAVPVAHSLLFIEALRQNKIAFEFHLFEAGGHGLGLANGHPWTDLLSSWLKSHSWD